MKINQTLLDLYASCETADEVVQAQNEWLAAAEKEKEATSNNDHGTFLADGDLPPEEEEDYEYYSGSDEDEPKVDKFGNYILEDNETEEQPKLDRFGNYIEENVEGEQEDLQPTLDRFGNFIEEDDQGDDESQR